MKKTLTLFAVTLVLITLFGSCKKENQTQSKAPFSIVGFWLNNGVVSVVEYDENNVEISRNSFDPTAVPTNSDEESFVNYEFKADGTTSRTSLSYDSNFKPNKYITISNHYLISNQKEKQFKLEILSVDGSRLVQDTANVVINNDNTLTLSKTEKYEDGSKTVSTLGLKRAPNGYTSPKN